MNKKQNKNTCRRCGSNKTNACGTPITSIIRYIKCKMPLRVCLSCNKKFHSRWLIQPKYFMVFTVSAMVGVGIVVKVEQTAIIKVLKSEAIVVYRYVYGDEHRKKLDKHWGWAYKSVENEKEDYRNHEE